MQVKFTAKAYLPDHRSIEEVANGSELPHITTNGTYFEREGLPQIGTVEVIITLHSENAIVSSQVAALQQMLETQRCKAYMAERAILEKISKLQALTFVGVAL